jgi:hypothetical protein
MCAFVSKRWLIHASDLVVLRCFHDRHLPCILGFSTNYPLCTYESVPLLQPLKLAAFSCHVASSCNDTFVARLRVLYVYHTRNCHLVPELAHHGASEYFIINHDLSYDRIQ